MLFAFVRLLVLVVSYRVPRGHHRRTVVGIGTNPQQRLLGFRGNKLQ